MQNILKNSLLGFAVACVLAAVLAIFAHPAHAQPSSIFVQTTATATTSVSYLSPGVATSTYQIDSYPTSSSSKVFTMAGIDNVYLYAQVAASSTATQYIFTPQFSNNNIDWYGTGSLGTPSAAGATAVSTTTSFIWTPGTTATTSMAFKLPDMAGIHERIITSVSGAAGALYQEIVLKKNPSTP